MSQPHLSVTLVGTGAVRVNPRRAAASQIVQIGDHPILIDCGRCAVQNMKLFGYPPESIRTLLLTHLHFDHVSDVPLLTLLSWNNGRDFRLPVFGPIGTREFMEHGVRQAYTVDVADRVGHGKDPAGLEWDVTEVAKEGRILSGKDWEVHAMVTDHGSLMKSWHYRFDTGDKRVVVTGDTQMDDRLAAFSEGADLLVIECSGTTEFLKTVPWGFYHITPAEVGRIATEARVKKVVLKHLVIENWTDDPSISDKMAEEVARIFPGEVATGYDGLRYEW